MYSVSPLHIQTNLVRLSSSVFKLSSCFIAEKPSIESVPMVTDGCDAGTGVVLDGAITGGRIVPEEAGGTFEGVLRGVRLCVGAVLTLATASSLIEGGIKLAGRGLGISPPFTYICT